MADIRAYTLDEISSPLLISPRAELASASAALVIGLGKNAFGKNALGKAPSGSSSSGSSEWELI